MALSPNFNVALTASGSPPSTDTVLFDQAVDGGPCTVFDLTSRTSSAGYAFVNVVGLHPAGYYAPIAPGENAPFRAGMMEAITRVTAYAPSGATVDTKIMAKI